MTDRTDTTDRAWECAARKPGATAPGEYPADCDWPVCGCDPHAVKVMDALTEMGLLSGKVWRD